MNVRQEIPDLTVCRAFLAAWVFTYHVDLYLNFSAWLGPCAEIVRHGYLGVDGFFILSGLILARVHPELSRRGMHPKLDSEFFGTPQPFHPRVWKFWGKRLARIYPLHFVTIILFAAVFGAGLAADVIPRDPSRFSIPALLENLALVQGWGFSSHGAWNYPSWSVSAEWAGYLLFPITWYIISFLEPVASASIVVGCMAVLGGITLAHQHNLNLAFGGGLLRFFPEFLIGLGTAKAVPRYADMLPTRYFAALAVGVLFIFASAGFDVLTVAGLWLLLFSLTAHADAERPTLIGNIRVLRWLGLLSYAFYMSFALAELLLSQIFRREGWTPASHSLVFATGMLTVTFFVAVILHVTVEVPCRRAADRWLERPASPKTPIRSKQQLS